MDAKTETLTAADELARDNPVRIRNESAAYRAARDAAAAAAFQPPTPVRITANERVLMCEIIFRLRPLGSRPSGRASIEQRNGSSEVSIDPPGNARLVTRVIQNEVF